MKFRFQKYERILSVRVSWSIIVDINDFQQRNYEHEHLHIKSVNKGEYSKQLEYSHIMLLVAELLVEASKHRIFDLLSFNPL